MSPSSHSNHSLVLRIISWFFYREFYCKNPAGLCRSTVLERSAIVTFRVSFGLCVICILVMGGSYFLLDIRYKFSFDSFTSMLLAFVALYWAIYSALCAEYVSKYQRLIAVHDEQLKSPNRRELDTIITVGNVSLSSFEETLLDDDHLNFAEDCLIYRMNSHESFKHTFNKITALLAMVRVQDQLLFNDMMYDLEELPRYIEGMDSTNAQDSHDIHQAAEARLNVFWKTVELVRNEDANDKDKQDRAARPLDMIRP